MVYVVNSLDEILKGCNADLPLSILDCVILCLDTVCFVINLILLLCFGSWDIDSINPGYKYERKSITRPTILYSLDPQESLIGNIRGEPNQTCIPNCLVAQSTFMAHSLPIAINTLSCL